MRKFTTLGLSVAALAASSWLVAAQAQTTPSPDTSAPAADTSTPAPAKPVHKSHSKSSHHATAAATKGDAAVDDLNSKSLADAKSGQAFKPPAEPAKEDAKPAKATKTTHHHAKKKAAAKPAADAPAPDASK